MKRIYYPHIPKTGGRTFHNILLKNFKREETFYVSGGSAIPANFFYSVTSKIVNELDEGILENVNLFYGHMPYSNRAIFQDDFVFLTILRDPVKRVISDYKYSITTPLNPMYHLVKSLSIQEYVGRNEDYHLDNLQTRLICGKVSGELNHMDLENAIELLSNKFIFGLTERFDETIFLFSKHLDWKFDNTYKSINKTKATNITIHPEDIEKIEAMNQYDIKLYEFCKEEFENRMAKHSQEYQSAKKKQKSLFDFFQKK